MSDQTTREAAARAWFAEPTIANTSAFWRAIARGGEYDVPRNAVVLDSMWALSLWMEWCREDAAKPAPAREAGALEGVVFTTPGAVVAWAEQGWDKPRPKPLGFAAMGVSSADGDALWSWLRTNDASGNGWPEHVGAVAAHARAQLAREAHEAAPAQPAAMTLEQARAMCREAGDTVVEAPPRPNYVKPAEMLAWFEASVAVRRAEKHMGDAASRCAMHDRDAWTETPDECTVESEIARLRALGVTPAVLS